MKIAVFPQVLVVSSAEERISIISGPSRRAVTSTYTGHTACVVLLLAFLLSCFTSCASFVRGADAVPFSLSQYGQQ